MLKYREQLQARAAEKRRSAFRFVIYSRFALSVWIMLWGVCAAHAQIVVTDIAGRQVELAAPPKRVILSAPYYFPALEILRNDAADLIVGVSGAYGMAEFEKTPHVGWVGSSFSIETFLELKPDLLIADGVRTADWLAVETVLAKVGIPIIYIDFAHDIARNTVPSIETLGRVFGEEERALQFIEFHKSHVERITDRIKTGRPVPQKLMMNLRRGWDGCCAALREGVNTYLDMVGVDNIAENMPGAGTPGAELSLEYIIASDPQIFIAITATQSPTSFFGTPRSLERAVSSLQKLANEKGFQGLAAMRSRRVHVVDISLMRSPFNVLLLELLAKWVHPDLFSDLDPHATLDELNERFLTTPRKGPFWASLDPAVDRPTGQQSDEHP